MSADAVVQILVKTKAYVRRFVILTTCGLTAPAPPLTLVCGVRRRLRIQKVAKISLKAATWPVGTT